MNNYEIVRETRREALPGGDGLVYTAPPGCLYDTFVGATTPTADLVARGSEVYARVCAECHGAEGEGHTYPPAPALDGSEHAWHHPDAQLREWITTGKIGMVEMPAYGEWLN